MNIEKEYPSDLVDAVESVLVDILMFSPLQINQSLRDISKLLDVSEYDLIKIVAKRDPTSAAVLKNVFKEQF